MIRGSVGSERRSTTAPNIDRLAVDGTSTLFAPKVNSFFAGGYTDRRRGKEPPIDIPTSIPQRRLGLAVQAGRLPFLTASVLPAAVGAAIEGAAGRPALAGLGILAVGAGHLSANLMNDLGDAATGVDAIDMRHFGFFGGSKLIQRGQASRLAYLAASLAAATVCLAAVAMLAWVRGEAWPLAAAGGAVLLAWAYSAGPKLSYHYGGEATVFLLFGPVATLAGHYAATGQAWSLQVFLASLPLGLMTAGILISNEVPDAPQDATARKRNLVALVGPRRGWVLYGAVAGVAALLACVAVWQAGFGPIGWASLAAVLPAGAATGVLRRHWRDKPRLVRSAALAILAQTVMAVGLLVGALLH